MRYDGRFGVFETHNDCSFTFRYLESDLHNVYAVLVRLVLFGSPFSSHLLLLLPLDKA